MYDKFLTVFCLALGLSLAFAGGAYAADHLIVQKNKSFEANGVAIDDIKVKVGDSLTFTNNDMVTHNIYSRDPGNEFEIPKQLPGVTASVVMKTRGEVNIRCAIHPKMKLHVTVEPNAPVAPRH